jgi:hypothetical protein
VKIVSKVKMSEGFPMNLMLLTLNEAVEYNIQNFAEVECIEILILSF